MRQLRMTLLVLVLSAYTLSAWAAPSRIKDVAKVVGLSRMQIIGYGLVVGLDGSGDRNLNTSRMTSQSVSNMLERFGITLPSEQLRLRNVAAVMVTADVPPVVQQGTQIDATVSSLGDARSLQGGTLLMTPLSAPDGTLYAHAQGAVTVGGFEASSGFGDRFKKNHTQVGRVVNGATMVTARRSQYVEDNTLSLALLVPDFSTAMNISERINQSFGEEVAEPLDQATIQVTIPDQGDYTSPVSFMAALEKLEVEIDRPARVVINERTGTVVVGSDVRLDAAAISHGNITVQIQQRPIISQPGPFSGGQTAVVPDAQMQVEEEESDQTVKLLEESATVGEVTTALNALGVKPRDLIAIFQALKQSGSLQAELVIM